jgi:hypothetical protein
MFVENGIEIFKKCNTLNNKINIFTVSSVTTVRKEHAAML